jgi:mannose-6-phosphate isomerase
LATNALYPLKLSPSLHKKVWGGRRLETKMRKRLPTAEPYGESWELHNSSMIANGPLRGTCLGDLARDYGAKILGSGNDPAYGFPLLAKLIDATEWLSIQVHPNDEQARILEGEPRGKTEAWVVLHAEAGAQLVIGLRHGTTSAEMAEAIKRHRLEELLVYATVKAGDVLQIPANTIHALGPGLVIYEIQQASDVTYRLYDWGRLGLDGQPRELHIDKGVHVANLESLPRVLQPESDRLVDGEYFRTWRHNLTGRALVIETGGRFQTLTCIAGRCQAEAPGQAAIDLSLGETGLIPACFDRFQIRGAGAILRSSQR